MTQGHEEPKMARWQSQLPSLLCRNIMFAGESFSPLEIKTSKQAEPRVAGPWSKNHLSELLDIGVKGHPHTHSLDSWIPVYWLEEKQCHNWSLDSECTLHGIRQNTNHSGCYLPTGAMHESQLANPLSYWAELLKFQFSKSKTTEVMTIPHVSTYFQAATSQQWVTW